jgi:hypothetical protein
MSDHTDSSGKRMVSTMSTLRPRSANSHSDTQPSPTPIQTSWYSSNWMTFLIIGVLILLCFLYMLKKDENGQRTAKYEIRPLIIGLLFSIPISYVILRSIASPWLCIVVALLVAFAVYIFWGLERIPKIQFMIINDTENQPVKPDSVLDKQQQKETVPEEKKETVKEQQQKDDRKKPRSFFGKRDLSFGEIRY